MRLRTIRHFAATGVLLAGCSVDARLGTEPVHAAKPTAGRADAAIPEAPDSAPIAPRAEAGGVATCAGNACSGQSGAGGCERGACNESGGAGDHVGTGSGGTTAKGTGYTGGAGSGSAGSGGATADAASPEADGSARSIPCNVTVDVTTATAHGLYAPSNVAAIWVQTSAGKFVKTLLLDGTIRASYLFHWVSVSASNRVDAVSGATRRTHGALTATWDCADTSEAEVPDGSYSVCVTFAESSCLNQADCSSSPMECVAFGKGPAAATFRGADTANFSDFVVTYR